MGLSCLGGGQHWRGAGEFMALLPAEKLLLLPDAWPARRRGSSCSHKIIRQSDHRIVVLPEPVLCRKRTALLAALQACNPRGNYHFPFIPGMGTGVSTWLHPLAVPDRST